MGDGVPFLARVDSPTIQDNEYGRLYYGHGVFLPFSQLALTAGASGNGDKICDELRFFRTIDLTRSGIGRPASNRAQAARPEGRDSTVHPDRRTDGPVRRKHGRRHRKSPSVPNGRGQRPRQTAKKDRLASGFLQRLARCSEPADLNALSK